MSESDSVSIQEAEPRDAEAIAGLVTTLAAELQERSPITPAYAADYLRTPGAHVLLAVRGGAVLGLLSFGFRPSLYHAADSCLIDELVVAPQARSQGVGAALLEEAIRRGRERGCAEVSLGVMNSNRDALRFYQRHGFEADALLLERHLHPESG